MSTLLAPTVVGPISVLSASVRIDGPLPGSNVQLFINAAPGTSVSAGSATTTYVNVVAGLLQKDDLITARWSRDGETSDPSTVPVKVLGLPEALSSLVYLSHIHTCADWVRLGGAYPGAKVELFNGSGALIGSNVAVGNEVSVRIKVPINAGERLSAIQSVSIAAGTLKSDGTPSLPVEPFSPHEKTMPAPAIGPIPGCAHAVRINGIEQGASTHLNYNGNRLEYPFVGESFLALLGGQANKTDTFTATQHFERCNASSAPSFPAASVDDTLPVRKPKIGIDEYSCPVAGKLPIKNLEPGAKLTIKLVKPSGETIVIGIIGVGEDESSAQYWIPDLSSQIPRDPPNPALVVVQELCGKSASSDETVVSGIYRGSVFPPTLIDPVIECANGVFVNNADSAVVQIFSDQADSPVISTPVFCAGGPVWVETFRSLRAGENIHAELLLSCQPPALRIGPAVKVDNLDKLNAPELQGPIRVYHKYVYVRVWLPGARVHIFVNGKWRASGTPDIYPTVFFPIYVGQLKAEDHVSALQTFCNKISQPTEPAMKVSPGQMVLSTQPPTLTQGKPETITVKAVDIDNMLYRVAATVSQAGTVVGATNTPFTLSPPIGPAAISLQASAPGYNDETIAIPLAPP